MIGSLFNDEKIKQNENIKKKEIVMKNLIDIRLKTVTPLLQMDNNSEQRKRYVSVDGFSFKEPFWSANGLRGVLRRVATRTLVEAVQEKDNSFKLKAEDLFLYTSGAGTDKKSIENVNFSNEKHVRQKAPILSLFGAGLSQISGKLAVEDMRIFSDERYTKTKDDKAFSPFIETHTFFRDDITKKLGGLAQLVDSDDVQRWQKENFELVATSKAKKASGEIKKESTSNMQVPHNIEAIRAETPLRTAINPINFNNLTDVELGCIVKALLDLAPLQIGSAKRYGYGRLDWNVSIEDKEVFNLERDREFSANYKLTVSDYGKEIISAYEDWLKENASEENIKIESILKQIA